MEHLLEMTGDLMRTWMKKEDIEVRNESGKISRDEEQKKSSVGESWTHKH